MATYPTSMEPEIERFENLFFVKKKSLEEFLSLLVERAEVEEAYSKAMERITTGLAVYSDRGPLADIMNSLKSYHALKSEQSQIFASSLKDEIILTLKEMLKKETLEARQTLSNGRKNDMEMRLLVDRVETTKKRYATLKAEEEEAQRTKAFLYNVEENSNNIEEKRKAIFEKIDKLTNQSFDCDVELKANLEEYNKFRSTFTEQCNVVVDFFKGFDERRLDSFKDSVMKYFVYEISYFRNIQYDVNKLIQKVETADFSKEISGSSFYRYKKEPEAIDFEKFKESFLKKQAEPSKQPESKPKPTFTFDKTQLPDLKNSIKSFVGFLTTPRSSDAKKKDEGAALEKYWSSLSQGQALTEAEEQALCKLMGQDAHRKMFISLFSKMEIDLKAVKGEEEENKIKETLGKVVQQFLQETLQNKDWETLKLYVSSIQRLMSRQQKETTEEGENVEGDKRRVYEYLDEKISSMSMLDNEELWKRFLAQNIKKSEWKKGQDRTSDFAKVRHEVAYMKHLWRNKEKLNSLIELLGKELELSEEETQNLINENIEVSSSEHSPSSGSKEGKENKVFDWIQKMEQKITEIENNKRPFPSIFPKKVLQSDPVSPLVNKISLQPEPLAVLKHSASDNISVRSPAKETEENESADLKEEKPLEGSEENTNLNTTQVSYTESA